MEAILDLGTSAMSRILASGFEEGSCHQSGDSVGGELFFLVSLFLRAKPP